MTNSELMLAALANGDEADATVSAALDELREGRGLTLLGAVLEVTRIVRARRDSRDVTQATNLIHGRGRFRDALKQQILDNALNVPDGALVTITVVPGEAPPLATDNSIDNGMYTTVLASVSVGALWVKSVASALQVERARRSRNARHRRSR